MPTQLTIKPILDADQKAIYRRAKKYTRKIVRYCDKRIEKDRTKYPLKRQRINTTGI